MGLNRSLTWALGAILIAVGIAIILFWSGVANWIPGAVLAAGVIIVLGIIVMGMANRSEGGGGGTTVHEEGGGDSPDVVKVD
jgi:MFS superfamily sulfate permease-like transporter